VPHAHDLGMGMSHIRAVVFDVGNTLWFEAHRPDPAEIERLQADRLRPLLRRWAVTLPCTVEEVVADVQAAGDEAARVEAEQGTFREVDVPFLLRGALGVRGVDITQEQAQEAWRETWILERHFGVQLYPDTLDVLRAVRDAGLLVGINTNRPCTAEMHLPGLLDMGIGEYVDAVACSGDTGYCKPHHSTFDLVLAKLGVAPGEAVMVGDGAAIDMRGGRAVGMTTVWKLNGRYDLPPCPEADYEIHDLAELLALPVLGLDAGRAVTAESLTPHEDGNAERY
jgi:HAD superfamily hydrolase (TIGR01509 family)